MAWYALVVTIIAAWIDYKKLIIPHILTIPSIIVALIVAFLHGNGMAAVISGAIMFASLLLLLFLTGGGIGGGDVYLLTFLAMVVGFPTSHLLVLLALLVAFAWSLILRKRNGCIPLAPPIFVGYAILMMTNM
ncbi:prepilin peptidase [Brevibacillus humidisoli]|uniref:prepilin peptidase n=1 Tax=Brevibacillus humidisoli TaxID=2895522 RepID=UPI001E327DF8|nr:prepilin peptidase [Brevibacillus humidisoli]UFJ41336.1 prepilin peptidase [Brevibacillus humidisoli]